MFSISKCVPGSVFGRLFGRVGLVVTKQISEKMNDQVVGSFSLCGIRDALGRRLWHGLDMTSPASNRRLSDIRKNQATKIHRKGSYIL
jgi:hypothetical protein